MVSSLHLPQALELGKIFFVECCCIVLVNIRNRDQYSLRNVFRFKEHGTWECFPTRLSLLGLCTRRCQCRHQSMSKEIQRDRESTFLWLSWSLRPSLFFGLFHSFPCHHCVSLCHQPMLLRCSTVEIGFCSTVDILDYVFNGVRNGKTIRRSFRPTGLIRQMSWYLLNRAPKASHQPKRRLNRVFQSIGFFFPIFLIPPRKSQSA